MTQAQRNAITTPAAGLIVYCTNCGANGELELFNGSAWVNVVGGEAQAGVSTVFIASGVSKVFMAHNLGADTSLDSHTPVQGIHGNYYQWGIIGSVANASTAATAISGWNTTAAVNGSWSDASKTVNDPCPAGYRVPTNAQWLGVIANNTVSRTGTWVNDATNFGAAIHWGPDAATKSLTLPAAGVRNNNDGTLLNRSSYGYYWSSTEGGTNAYFLYFGSTSANTSSSSRAYGFSVRCVSE